MNYLLLPVADKSNKGDFDNICNVQIEAIKQRQKANADAQREKEKQSEREKEAEKDREKESREAKTDEAVDRQRKEVAERREKEKREEKEKGENEKGNERKEIGKEAKNYPPFSWPLSNECISHFGLTRPNDQGVWVAFREVVKHLDDIVSESTKEKFADRTKRVVVCAICETDVANLVLGKKSCFLTYALGSTASMNKHLTEKHDRDVRLETVTSAVKAGKVHTQTAINWAIAASSKVEHSTMTRQEKVNKCLALFIAEYNLPFTVFLYEIPFLSEIFY